MLDTSFEVADLENITEDKLLKVLDNNRKKAHELKQHLKELQKTPKKFKTPTSQTPMIEEEIQEEENTFENEIDFYLNNLNSITLNTKEEDIIHLLPPRRKANYREIILRLKLECYKTLREFKEWITTETTLKSEDLESIQNKVQLERKKLDILNQLLLLQPVEKEENSIKNHFVFVPTSGGNIRVLEELDSIPTEFYSSFKTLFQSIQDGTFKGVKRFGTSHVKLAGISEVRDVANKTRVVFDRIGPDTYAIITAFTKNIMQSHGYHEKLERKIGNYRTWLPTLKANLENEEFMAEQENYEQELWNKLSSSEKSQRGGDNRCKKK